MPSLKLDRCKQKQIVVWCKRARKFKSSGGKDCSLNVNVNKQDKSTLSLIKVVLTLSNIPFIVSEQLMHRSREQKVPSSLRKQCLGDL